ncbi:hypothetical protein AVEN_206885-1 [Araneus ventricosus]|uniref:Uncharacterized protein n=1 Tax=Araneus ventricosus TaxID=182803 RepID=A0A4Y2PZM7_ARAVE|nr:hypothetical protein AVEN_206885-1 [Araneus ventricosus]
MVNSDRGKVPRFHNHKSYAGVTGKNTTNLLIADHMNSLTVIYSCVLSSSSVCRCYLRDCPLNDHHMWLACGLSEKCSTLFSWENVLAGRKNITGFT